MIAGRARNHRIAQPLEKIVSVAAPHKLIRINAQRPTRPNISPSAIVPAAGLFRSIPVRFRVRNFTHTRKRERRVPLPEQQGRDGNTEAHWQECRCHLRRLPFHGKCALAAGLAGRAILFDLFPLGGLLCRTRSQRGWRTLRVAVPGRWVYRRTWRSWRRSSGQRAHSRSRSARGG